ncbi:Glu/Leu/Phe/Val dehydrogenase [Pandoraea terrae]|uniref:Glu/Leu/Phe/Val dehydrogenase n=2 Tax=Pandoraea terrae TaxID=1537710 RepID=A0A5E4ZEK7_9BURK|nr:Glu/Leu/Phe/Val dehydrogenase [Pandoraea terrae]
MNYDAAKHVLTEYPQAAELPAAKLFGVGGERDHETIALHTDPDTGLKAIVAIHSRARGPAFGGCRYWHYVSDAAALQDALRLSQGMSLKNALADLPFGGGKSVILRPHTVPQGAPREALFAAFGKFIESLNGAYLTAEDVGTTVTDMAVVRRHTRFVSGLPREGEFGGDPSPKTALGVFSAIEVSARKLLGRASLEGLRVGVQGLGSVGWALSQLLADAGAVLTVADLRAERVAEARERFGATVACVDDILRASVDVIAPCALGGALDAASVDAMAATIVAGAANNQLQHAGIGDRLHARGIYYAPDFLINAGGIVSVAREWLGEGDETNVTREVLRIGDRMAELIERTRANGTTPAFEAESWARAKLVRPQA